MAFPDTPLSANVEIYYSAGWHAIPSNKIRVSHGMTVTRGIQDESSRVDNSSFEFTINNLNGDYSPRNPRSPLFGLIGRNTPLRFALNGFDVIADSFNRYVAAGWGMAEYDGEMWTYNGSGGAVAVDDTSIIATAAQVSTAAYGMRLSGAIGTYASTPDNAALDIVGDIDLRADMTHASWRPAGASTLVAKWTEPTNNRSYLFYLDPTGVLAFAWSANGIAVAGSCVSTVIVPAPISGRLALRVTMDVDNGAAGRTITFYTAPNLAGTWTQLGAPVVQAGITSIFSSAAILEVGTHSAGTIAPLTGTVHGVEVRNLIGGTAAANPDFSTQAAGVTSFADAATRTWTLNGSAAFFDAPSNTGASMSVPATSAFRFNYLPNVGVADIAVTVRTRWLDRVGGFDVLGNDVEGGLMLRVQNISTYYHPRLEYNADQTLTASIHAIGGTGSLGTATVPAITYTGQWLWVKGQCVGSTIRMKVWTDGTAEPAAWTLSVVDTQITAAGGIGVRSGVASGNTNIGRMFYYSDFMTDHAFRAAGEVVAWPQKWTVGGKDVWVPIQIAGIKRRLGITTTGQAVSRSALRRMILSPAAVYRPYSYYPMEEKPAASGLADVVGAGSPMVVSGTADAPAAANFGSSTLFVGSDGLPALDQRALSWRFPTVGASETEWTIQYVGAAEGSFASITQIFLASGMRILHDVVNGYEQIRWYDATLSTLYDSYQDINTPLSNWFDGNPHTIQIGAKQVGGNITWTMMLDGSIVSGTRSFAGTLSRPASGEMNTSKNSGMKATFGHYAVYAGVSGGSLPALTSAMIGWANDTAAGRIARLCAEEGVTLSLIGTRGTVNTSADGSERVGVQRVAAFNDLTQDAADADRGLLYEPRGFLGLAYRTGSSLYNQAPTVALTYSSSGHVAWPLDPIDDDSAIENDVTVSRYQGGSARVEQLTGPLNVREPSADPNGAGRYAREHQLVLYTDAQCLNTAAWFRHLGTWDEARYPNVNVNVAHLAAKTGSTLPGQALSLGIGHRFTVDSLPNWLPPEQLQQHALGFVETFNGLQLDIKINAVPALPYEVFTVQTGSGNRSRIPAGVSTVAKTALSTVSASMNVFSPNALWINSTFYAAQFPFDAFVRGERMRVTAINDFATDTFTRAVAAGWGTTTTGAQVWTLGAGTAADFSVNGAHGLHSHSAVNAVHNIMLASLGLTDMDVFLDLDTSIATPTGADIVNIIDIRYVDGNNHYRLNVTRKTTNVVTIDIVRVLAGVTTTLVSASGVAGVVPANNISIRFQVSGSQVRAKSWLAGAPEPDLWHISATDSAPGALAGASGGLRVSTVLNPGNTNALPVVFHHDFLAIEPQVFTITRGINGVSLTHAVGESVQLYIPPAIAL